MKNLPNNGFNEICPSCSSSFWKERKLPSMNSYYVCNRCSLNIQEISNNFSKDDYFKMQQEHHFGDSEFLTQTSPLLKKIESEGNNFKLKMVNKYLTTHSDVVEIGSGAGSFAKLMEDQHFNVSIIEESLELSIHLKKVIQGKVINKNLSEYQTDEKHNAVCSFQVIEHVIDLREHLEDIRNLLQMGGLIFLTTPNSESFQHKLPFGLSPNFDSAHLYVLSKRSLILLLNKSGFELIEITTPEYPAIWLRVASKILRRIKGKSETETAGEYIVNSSPSYQAIYNSFKFLSAPFRYIQSSLGKGNEIFIVARKIKE
ncbi:class I SAM-dependent methyltransferase [Gammaproteobacteria bacterium]|nr:class I SAM-dependent methyltransferase [Gammaproteobacteria bacterium]